LDFITVADAVLVSVKAALLRNKDIGFGAYRLVPVAYPVRVLVKAAVCADEDVWLVAERADLDLSLLDAA
jgi:hypothetical protein